MTLSTMEPFWSWQKYKGVYNFRLHVAQDCYDNIPTPHCKVFKKLRDWLFVSACVCSLWLGSTPLWQHHAFLCGNAYRTKVNINFSGPWGRGDILEDVRILATSCLFLISQLKVKKRNPSTNLQWHIKGLKIQDPFRQLWIP